MIQFNKQEIENIVVQATNDIHPFYNEMTPKVAIYTKDVYPTIEFPMVRIGVDYDHFGCIEDHDGVLVAHGNQMGVGYLRKVSNIKDGIEFLIKNYFGKR